jgi:hypothetical protein
MRIVLIWMCSIAIGIGTAVIVLSSPGHWEWIPLLAGSLLLSAAILIGLGLALPPLGQRLLTTAWPGQFSARQQRQIAT